MRGPKLVSSPFAGLAVVALLALPAACGSNAATSSSSGSSSGSGGGASAASGTSSSGGGAGGGTAASSGSTSVAASSGSTSGSTSSSSSGASGSSGAGSSGSSSSGACPPANVYLASPKLIPVMAQAFGGVATLDANLDGKLDLVASWPVGAGIFLGNGDGTFAAEADILSAGGGGDQAIIASFAGTKYPDIIAPYIQQAYFAQNNADGTGTYQGFVESVRTTNPIVKGATGDFDGDGKPDLAFVTSDSIAIALNQGQGTFPTLAVDYGGNDVSVFGSTGNGAGDIWVGDVDGDGLPDVVVSSNAAASEGNSTYGGLCVFLNKGHGSTFSAATCFPVSPDLDPFSLAMADLNGDGAPDAVIGGSGTHNVNVFLNKNDKTGGFKNPVPFATTMDGVFTSVVLADVNGDGKLDLLGFYEDGGPIEVAYGKGDGTFDPSTATYAAGVDPTSITPLATGVFTANGLTSVAVLNDTATSTAPNGGIQLLLGSCSP